VHATLIRNLKERSRTTGPLRAFHERVASGAAATSPPSSSRASWP